MDVVVAVLAGPPFGRFGKGKPASGRGDAVSIYDGDPGVITSQHNGRSNFAVTAYADDDFPPRFCPTAPKLGGTPMK